MCLCDHRDIKPLEGWGALKKIKSFLASLEARARFITQWIHADARIRVPKTELLSLTENSFVFILRKESYCPTEEKKKVDRPACFKKWKFTLAMSTKHREKAMRNILISRSGQVWNYAYTIN